METVGHQGCGISKGHQPKSNEGDGGGVIAAKEAPNNREVQRRSVLCHASKGESDGHPYLCLVNARQGVQTRGQAWDPIDRHDSEARD